MATPEPRSPKSNRPPNGNGGADPNFHWRGLFLFALAICAFAGFYALSKSTGVQEIPYSKFVEMLDEGKIATEKGVELVFESNSATDFITGYLRTSKEAGAQSERFKTQVNLQYDKDLQWML